MPARIYALAKELNIDSKDLVDLVKKVGITGKGSALASLTDEEAQKVRDHLSSAEKPAQPAVAAVAPGAVRDVVPFDESARGQDDIRKPHRSRHDLFLDND